MNTSATRYIQRENIRLQKENQTQQEYILALQNYVDVLANLYWAAQQIEEEENPIEMLDQCLYEVINVMGAQDGSIAYLDQETEELVFVIVHGALREQLTGHRIRGEEGVAGWVLSNDEPVIVNNTRQDWRFSDQVDQEFSFLTKSILCTPVVQDSETIGVIELINKEPLPFNETDMTLLGVLSDVAASVFVEMQARHEPILKGIKPPSTLAIEDIDLNIEDRTP